MTYIPNKDIVEKLTEVECRLDLLRYEIDGWSAWPLIRLGLAKSLQNKPQELMPNYLGKYDLMKIIASDLWGMTRIKKAKFAVKTYSTARREKANGREKDVFFDELLLQTGNYCKIEDINNVSFFLKTQNPLIRSNFTSTFANIMSYKLGSVFVPAKIRRLAEEFKTLLQKEFGETPFTIEKISRRLVDFYWEKRIYAWLFKKIRPEYLLLGSIAQFPYVAAARELGIKTVEFQHGFLDRYHFVYAWSSYAKPYKSKMPLPEKIFLFGNYWKDELLKTGYWQSELEPIGNTHFDNYRNTKKQIGNDKCNMILTTQGIDTKRLILFIKKFLEEIQGKCPYSLKIKMHPHYDANYDLYKESFQKFPGVSIVHPKDTTSILDLLAQSNVHLSIFSTCHYEALGLGIPTIILPLSGHENSLHLLNYPGTVLAHSPQELASIILNLDKLKVSPDLSHRLYQPKAIDNMVSHFNLQRVT